MQENTLNGSRIRSHFGFKPVQCTEWTILLIAGIAIEARVMSDTTAGIGMASRQCAGRFKHLEVLLKKHGTETDTGDLGTKYLAKPRMNLLLGLLSMTLLLEADASVWVAATASVTGGAWLSPCIVLVLCMVAAAGGCLLLLRRAPTAAPLTTAEPTPVAAATRATTGPAAASTAALRVRSATVAQARAPDDYIRTAKFLEFMLGDEVRMLLRSRRLQTSGSTQMLRERLASGVAATAGQAEFLKFMNVDEMHVLLRSRGLRVSGLKQDLSERLAGHAAKALSDVSA